MASRNVTVAQAVKVALNAAAATSGTFGEAFVARRVYVPLNSLEALEDLQATVYAAGDEQELLTRKLQDHDITVEIGLQKRLTPDCDPETEAGNTEIDALVELSEKVADFFSPGGGGYAAMAATARWNKTALALPSYEHLTQFRTFSSVITLTYKLAA